MFSAKTKSISIPIENARVSKECGHLMITGEENKRGSGNVVHLECSGVGFTQRAILLRLSRITREKAFTAVYQSELTPENRKMHGFKEIIVPSYTLYRDDDSSTIKIEVLTR
jgi:hypothetical protein